MSEKLTKIVATLGPASDSEERIRMLIESGVDVFRFNTKHGTPEWHEERINRVQKIADSVGASIGILLDLQGPEIRIETRNQEDVGLSVGEHVRMGLSFDDPEAILAIGEQDVFDKLAVGDKIYIDDGKVALQVVDKGGSWLMLSAEKKTTIKHRKGVNLPDKTLDLPSLVEADLRQLDMASLNKVDFVALSFVRTVADIEVLKQEIADRGMDAKVISKIENRMALNNLDSLIEASDAVMVARGDMGVEVAIEEIAYWQKKIIEKCRKLYKPVITATEMLESMTREPRPTRAEATDVSNAVFDGTDAVMLSAETAMGEYPVEAVSTMARIAAFTESKKNGINNIDVKAGDMTQLICLAAFEMIKNEGVKVDKIVVFTHSGYTARVISAFRPNVPIIAITDQAKTVETLALTYAAMGIVLDFPHGEIVSPNEIVNKLVQDNLIKEGEAVLVIHGARWKTPGLTNSITLVTA